MQEDIDILAIIILAIAAIGIFGGSSFIGGWAGFSIFIFGIAFIELTIYFFLDYKSYGEHHGFRAIHRIKHLIRRCSQSFNCLPARGDASIPTTHPHLSRPYAALL